MDIHTATEYAYKNGYDTGVKEFAERLKEEIEQNTFDNGYVYSGTLYSIVDNLLEEMMEG